MWNGSDTPCASASATGKWLLIQQSAWGAENGSHGRVTALAGRMRTRLNISRPQQRWETGVALARQTVSERTRTRNGDQPLSIGSRIRNAVSFLNEALANF